MIKHRKVVQGEVRTKRFVRKQTPENAEDRQSGRDKHVAIGGKDPQSFNLRIVCNPRAAATYQGELKNRDQVSSHA